MRSMCLHDALNPPAGQSFPPCRTLCSIPLQGPDASTDLGMLDLLNSGELPKLPLLPHLLQAPLLLHLLQAGGPAASRGAPLLPPAGTSSRSVGQGGGAAAAPVSPSYSCSEEEEGDEEAVAAAAAAADGLLESPLMQAEAMARRFNLNPEQVEVLQYVAGWCSPGSSRSSGGSSGLGSAGKAAVAAGSPPPVCLVHGPFGSGACVRREVHRSVALASVFRTHLGNREATFLSMPTASPPRPPRRQVHPAGGAAALHPAAAWAAGLAACKRPRAGGRTHERSGGQSAAG